MNKAANLGLSKTFSQGFKVVSSKEKRGGSDVLLLQFNVLLMRYSGDTGLTSSVVNTIINTHLCSVCSKSTVKTAEWR